MASRTFFISCRQRSVVISLCIKRLARHKMAEDIDTLWIVK